jgi:hypothetical protein
MLSSSKEWMPLGPRPSMAYGRTTKEVKSSKPRRIRVPHNLYKFTPDDPQSLIALRERLRSLSYEELHRFVIAAEYMSSPGDGIGYARLQSFAIQLREAQTECQRRRQKRSDST